MSCTTSKFTITRGLDNNFVFTIKADGTTLPMEIDPTDTFVATLVTLADDTTVLTKSLTISDSLGGKVALTISAAEASALSSDKGTKADRYYLRPVYKLVIDCSTVNNGDFLAKVPEVYVD